MTSELSPGEYRHAGLQARRWAMVCIDAGQVAEALHQISEAARFFALADDIASSRRGLALHDQLTHRSAAA